MLNESQIFGVLVLGGLVLLGVVFAITYLLLGQRGDSPVPAPSRPKRQYLNNDAIVQDLLQNLAVKLEDRQNWLSAEEDELIQLHHGTGRNIRNQYHMWDDRNPYSVIDPPPNLETGLFDHPDFPDQRSMVVITRVWGELRRRYGPLPLDVRQVVRRNNGLDAGHPMARALPTHLMGMRNIHG